MEIIVYHKTYRRFARKYGIRITKDVDGHRVHRPISELKTAIRAHEAKNIPKYGLYYGTKENYADRHLRLERLKTRKTNKTKN